MIDLNNAPITPRYLLITALSAKELDVGGVDYAFSRCMYHP